MKKFQLRRQLITVLVVLAGCSPGEKHQTVAEYLHDIDSAKAALKHYSNDPGKYQGNADWANASAATMKIQFMNECWPKTAGERFTTANTDHSCLDRKGFKR